MSLHLKQSHIIGLLLLVSGGATFGISIVFFKFSLNQLISIDAFENELINEMAEGKAWYDGAFGFAFDEPLKLPPYDANEVNMLVGNLFLTYLEKTDAVPIFKNGQRHIKCSIPKFKDAAIFAMCASILQIAISLFYILWKQKNMKIMSIAFYTYFFIFLIHLTCFCIVLNTKPNRSYETTKTFNYRRLNSDIFSIILAINCLSIISSTILTCVRCNTEDYSDRCIDQETCNRMRSTTPGGNTLSSAHASTDRLNK